MSHLTDALDQLNKRIGEFQTVADGSSHADLGDCKDLRAVIVSLRHAAIRAENEILYHVKNLERRK